MSSSRRLLLVHAHPDDETINNGATMARYVAEGAQVTLLTCTLGEEGEILVPELAQLAADQADQLGGYRIGELRAAMAALGVTDSRFLGGAGRYRDSGMMGTAANEHPRAFWNADLDEAVGAAVAVVREVRPQVVVTYDENGGYGHPDHIQAHRVAMGAVDGCRRPGLPARPRASRGTSPRSTGAACRARCSSRASTRWRSRVSTFFEGVTDAARAAVRRRRRGGGRGGRRRRLRRCQARRDARPPDPDPGRRAVLRAVQQPGPGGARHRVLPAGPGERGPRRRARRVGGRPVRRTARVSTARRLQVVGWSVAAVLVSAWMAVVEVLWLPLRVGGVLVPLSVVGAVVGNLRSVIGARRLSGSAVIGRGCRPSPGSWWWSRR